MIVDKTLLFGYGDIGVGSDSYLQQISFQQFKPPGQCGYKVNKDVEYIGSPIIIDISYMSYCELNKKLDSVLNREISIFTFDEYIFDFTKYNEGSVRACRKHLHNCMANYIGLMAC